MNKLNVTVIATENSEEWEVVDGITFLGIQVFPGDISDGASIPWYVRWLLKKGGPLFTPSVIHDIGYGRGLMIRKKVDDIFMEAMILNKVERWKRYLIYKAVRLRGASRYNNNRG